MNWSAIFGEIGPLFQVGSVGTVIAIFGMCAVYIIKNVPHLTKSKSDAEGAAQDRFIKRIEGLEDDNAKIREDFTKRMDDERTKHDGDVRLIHVEYEADLRALRHEVRNLRQMLDMFIFMAEERPEKVNEFVTRFRSQIEAMDANVAREKSAIMGAKIVAAGRET